MDPKAIDKAKSRYRVASKALRELNECNNFEDFKDTWFTFLVAWKSIYTALEQGSKVTPQSRQWYGGVKSRRKNSETLQYLFEARNDDEHGMEWGVTREPGSVAVGVNKEGYSRAMAVRGDGKGGTIVTSMDGKPILTEETLPHAKLVDIKARGNRIYKPPTLHNSQPLKDKSPYGVSSVALAALEEIIKEAEGLS